MPTPSPDPERILDQLDALQRDLNGAREDAERGERLELLGTLAGMIAHEVRGIATKIVGTAQLIERDADSPERVRALSARIARQGLHAGRVAEAILSAADEPVPGDCLVIEPHRRALDALPSEARSRIDDSSLPTDLRVGMDADALERVLVNLYLNAWRAVGGLGSSGCITISARPCSARNIQISVRDEGPGVHPELLSTVFEPWSRGEVGSGGHGLGLALCRHLVEASGGSIRFAPPTDPPAQGAEVILELPIENPLERASAA